MREVEILEKNFPKMMYAILCKAENTLMNIPFLYWLNYLSSDPVFLSISVASRLRPPLLRKTVTASEEGGSLMLADELMKSPLSHLSKCCTHLYEILQR